LRTLSKYAGAGTEFHELGSGTTLATGPSYEPTKGGLAERDGTLRGGSPSTHDFTDD